MVRRDGGLRKIDERTQLMYSARILSPVGMVLLFLMCFWNAALRVLRSLMASVTACVLQGEGPPNE